MHSDRREINMKELNNRVRLRFRENGCFKAVVLADLHAKIGGLTQEQKGYITTILDRERPDLVIFTGDTVRSYGDIRLKNEAEFRQVLDSVVRLLEDREIYWMHVFGNHDREEHPLSLARQLEIYREYPHCLSGDADAELTGVGNYLVPLYDQEGETVKFAFWGLDSGANLGEEDRTAMFPQGISGVNGYSGVHYDYIHSDQIEWYKDVSRRLEEYAGGKVAGLMAFHIPLQEFNTAWLNRAGLPHDGEKHEHVCASAHNSGLFEALRYRGDIRAVVCGHDHTNTFMVEYCGIKLCYSPTVSTNSYHNKDGMGARVFVLSEKDPSRIETYVSYL